MFSSWESTVALIAAVLIAYGVVLWLGTIVWAYRDIRARTQDGWTQAISVLIVVVFNLPGLFLYLVLRPQETLNEVYERRLEAEALMRDLPGPAPACSNCNQPISNDFLVCPNCRAALREPCSNCSRPLELSWTACPYCASPGPRAAANQASTTAATPRPVSQTQPPRKAPPPPRATPMSSSAAKPQSAAESLWRRIVG